ncbi:MAG: hypothetical protein ACRDCE_11475 [Cetobacterium sp.]|uniref:hypothetical protein n=1 Tax=Cetobacterium sp. TaxID=2071632 RepID=UPI003EE607BE
MAKQQPYKGNRDPNSTRPYHYDTITEHIIGTHPHIVVDGIEADDWLAIEQRADPEHTCISTRDKDMLTVFGNHHRPACGAKQPEIKMHWVTPYQATEFFMYQMLIGDSTDNIPGCGEKKLVMWGGKEVLRRKGVGSGKAKKILDLCNSVGEMYEAVKAEYQAIFSEDDYEDRMLENARLLYVGQNPDKLFEWSWLDFSLTRNNNSVNNEEKELDMNLYEVKLHGEDAGTAMINMESIRLAQDLGDFVAIHLGGELVLHVDKNSIMAAFHATGSGFFKMETAPVPEDEPKDDVNLTE